MIDMTIKEQVLLCLEEQKNESISGEELAGRFGVSRTAVWKAIKTLREEGYKIEAVTNRGYRLAGSLDHLTEAGVASFLEYAKADNLTVYDEVDSTNTRAKEMADKGAPHGSVVIADCQTAGRGRLGRSFSSPSGSGIYMSIILRPKHGFQEAMLITTAAAASVCKAVRELTGADAGIKWVNDIYIGKKKICGILTEAMTDFETGSLASVIVGIGINFRARPESYPAEVLERLTWIYEDEPAISRNRLAAAIADELLRCCDNLEDRAFLDYYRQHAIMLDKDVLCIRGNESWNAHTLDIDDAGGLVVRMPDGEVRTLSSGEISIRW